MLFPWFMETVGPQATCVLICRQILCQNIGLYWKHFQCMKSSMKKNYCGVPPSCIPWKFIRSASSFALTGGCEPSESKDFHSALRRIKVQLKSCTGWIIRLLKREKDRTVESGHIQFPFLKKEGSNSLFKRQRFFRMRHMHTAFQEGYVQVSFLHKWSWPRPSSCSVTHFLHHERSSLKLNPQEHDVSKISLCLQ